MDAQRINGGEIFSGAIRRLLQDPQLSISERLRIQPLLLFRNTSSFCAYFTLLNVVGVIYKCN